MKKLSFLSLLLIAFTGCQIEELETPMQETLPETEMTTYYVAIDSEVETRTSLSNEGKILWSEGDKMNVFFGINNNEKDALVLMGGAGTENGSFYGPYIATPDDVESLHQTVIVYPYDENMTCTPNEDKTEYSIAMTVPSVQQYAKGSFGNGAYPMVGVTKNTKEVVISTKNVLSGMNVKIKGDVSISKIVLTSADLALAGPATVVAAYGKAPVVTVEESTALNTVELVCDGVQLNSEEATEFHATFAPCSGKITVTIYDTEGGYMTKTTKATDFTRNDIFQLPELTYVAEHSIQKDLANAFKNGGEYTLPMDVTVSEALLITGGKTLNLNLNGYTLTSVADLSGTNGCIQSTGAELNIANGKINNKDGYLFVTNGYNDKLHLELTDVDIKGSATSAFYFADATEIVLNNVNLDIKGKGFYSFAGTPKGSIEINGGTYKTTGKIFDFKSTLPVVFKGNCLFSKNDYDGAQWVESGDDVYKWKPVGYNVFVGTKGYYSISDAVAAVKTSATITIASDYEMTESVVIPADKSIILDLNGKTISQTKECTASYSLIDNKGQLTITGNGTIRFEDLSNGGSSTWGSYIINNTGELVVENGTLEHLGTADGNFDTCIPIQNYAGKVTVNDGLISSPEFRSLRDFTAGGEIIINGGKFNGQVWMQGLGNGTSSLTINGGEFGPTANDGSSIFITNGTNDVKVAIAGGKFNTKIGCTDASKSGVAGCISGGLFTESARNNTNAALLKSGLIFAESGDESYPYTPKLDVKATVGGVEYNTVAEAFAAAQEGQTVTVKAGEYTFPASSLKAGVTVECEEGTVFTGSSKLNIKGATVINAEFTNPTGSAVTSTINGTFKDCVFEGSNALRSCYAGDNVVFENCVFSGSTYGVHFDGGANDATFKKCTFSGFNAFGAALTQLTLEDCVFVSNGKSGYNGANLWGSTTLKNTTFKFDGTASNEWIDCIGSDKTYVIENCVVEGPVNGIFNKAYIFSRNKETDITINGVLYEDYMVNTISTAEELKKFAKAVNDDKNQFSGKTVFLTADINLNNEVWTPIGQTGATTFNGVFDGQNHTISNLNVDSEAQTGAHYSSGLFGWVESHTAGHGHIKNVKIDGATIVGHHNCGALVGYITQQTALVENCHVSNATISCTKANDDADGDKAGALIGNATNATPVIKCTAAKSTVSAGRDAGQVIGAGREANVTECSASEVTVSANGTSTGKNVRNEVIGRLL